MPDYRRLRIADGRYFFTVNLADRRSCLLTERAGDLRHVVRRIRVLAPFRIDAWVVLPDHMHAVWTLPESLTENATMPAV
jgi:putative transposase